MITFERSFDYELIRRILIHPRIWPHVTDDGSPQPDHYQPARHEAIWYVIVRDVDEERDDLLGLWMFTPHNSICWEVHTALLPIAWGARGQAAARMLAAWIWANTPCRRIITSVARNNRLALQFAIKAGMRIFGVNRDSFLKNGVICDQLCLGLSAPAKSAHVELPDSTVESEDLCQQQYL